MKKENEYINTQIDSVTLSVVFSHHRVPILPEVRNHIAKAKKYSSNFPVSHTAENTQGLTEVDDDGKNRVAQQVGSFGRPPQPVSFLSKMARAGPGTSWKTMEILQDNKLNLQSAWNQCVVVAIANCLWYLQVYSDHPWANGGSTFQVMDQITRGYARFNPNDSTWTPVPSNSLVAWVDKYASRGGTTSYNAGQGSYPCDQFDGLFLYTKNRLKMGGASFKHEGFGSKYGQGGSCDTGQYSSNEISIRKNPKPTWQWIYDELSAGHAVIINFFRYNSSGQATSGHSVRVWGAGRSGYDSYIYTLDDSVQGEGNGKESTGLRTQKWVVKDTGSSATGQNPGPPDGYLNLDGLSWEIKLSISIESIHSLGAPNVCPAGEDLYVLKLGDFNPQNKKCWSKCSGDRIPCNHPGRIGCQNGETQPECMKIHNWKLATDAGGDCEALGFPVLEGRGHSHDQSDHCFPQTIEGEWEIYQPNPCPAGEKLYVLDFTRLDPNNKQCWSKCSGDHIPCNHPGRIGCQNGETQPECMKIHNWSLASDAGGDCEVLGYPVLEGRGRSHDNSDHCFPQTVEGEWEIYHPDPCPDGENLYVLDFTRLDPNNKQCWSKCSGDHIPCNHPGRIGCQNGETQPECMKIHNWSLASDAGGDCEVLGYPVLEGRGRSHDQSDHCFPQTEEGEWEIYHPKAPGPCPDGEELFVLDFAKLNSNNKQCWSKCSGDHIPCNHPGRIGCQNGETQPECMKIHNWSLASDAGGDCEVLGYPVLEGRGRSQDQSDHCFPQTVEGEWEIYHPE